MTIFTDEQVNQAYKKAPSHVREFIEEGRLLDVIELVATSLTLSMEKEIELAELMRNSIIGLVGPADFQGSLAGLGMSAEQTSNILKQVKEKVFEVLKNPPTSVASQGTNEVTQVNETSELTNVPADAKHYVPPNLPGQSPLPSTPISINKLASFTPPPAPTPKESLPEVVRPRTMVSDVEAFEPPAVTVPAKAAAPKPARAPQTQVPVEQPKTTDSKEIQEDLKKYGVDPYRESVT